MAQSANWTKIHRNEENSKFVSDSSDTGEVSISIYTIMTGEQDPLVGGQTLFWFTKYSKSIVLTRNIWDPFFGPRNISAKSIGDPVDKVYLTTAGVPETFILDQAKQFNDTLWTRVENECLRLHQKCTVTGMVQGSKIRRVKSSLPTLKLKNSFYSYRLIMDY